MANSENLKPFKKGSDSRRANGRSKGARNLSTVLAEMLKKVAPDVVADSKAIAEFARKKRITVEDALAARLLYEAIVKGNMKAFSEINKMCGNYAPTRLAHEGKDGEAEIKSEIRVILPPENILENQAC